MRVGYARQSTNTVSAKTTKRLKAAGCVEVYQDDGSTAAQPALMQALGRLKDGDVLVVSRLDELGTELGEIVQRVKEIDARAAHLISLGNAIDTTELGGRAVFSVVSALSSADGAQRSARVRAGMLAARRRGQHLGRPPKLTVDQVRQAAARVLHGTEPISDVARSLGVSPLTLRRRLALLRNSQQEERRIA